MTTCLPAVSVEGLPAVQTTPIHCMIKDLLGIPGEMEIYDMMALGYPALLPRAKFMRDTEKIVHHDYCEKEDFRTDEEVREFVKRSRNWNIGTHSRKAD